MAEWGRGLSEGRKISKGHKGMKMVESYNRLCPDRIRQIEFLHIIVFSFLKFLEHIITEENLEILTFTRHIVGKS